MGSKRWLAPWKDSGEKPAIYHCISRVVDRKFVFGDAEREQFRMFMNGVNVHEWGQCSRIHKMLARLENAGQFPAWLGNPGSNIQERFTM
jgi:hypothetical protein